MDKIKNSEVANAFNKYPERIREKMIFLRQLVLDTAIETNGVDVLEETLKWGSQAISQKAEAPSEWIGRKNRQINMQCIFIAKLS